MLIKFVLLVLGAVAFSSGIMVRGRKMGEMVISFALILVAIALWTIGKGI